MAGLPVAALPTRLFEPPSTKHPEGLMYHLGLTLGKGAFGHCVLATIGGKAGVVAIKAVNKNVGNVRLQQKFQTEMQVQSKLKHRHVCELYRAFTYGDNTYLVMELCPNGSLDTLIKERIYLSEPEVRFYAVQLAGALRYLHNKGVMHRDLKAANLFLDDKMNLKVGDYGLSALIMSPKDRVYRRTTFCGTPGYMAPEVFDRSGHTHTCDYFAIAVIIFNLLTGHKAFPGTGPDEVQMKVANRDYKWPDPRSSQPPYSAAAKDLVAKLMNEPENRLIPDDIVDHLFITEGYMPAALSVEFKTRAPRLAELTEKYAGESGRNLLDVRKAANVGRENPMKRVTSMVRELISEEVAGLTPPIPLPDGEIYFPLEPAPSKAQGKHAAADGLAVHRSRGGIVSSMKAIFEAPVAAEQPVPKKRAAPQEPEERRTRPRCVGELSAATAKAAPAPARAPATAAVVARIAARAAMSKAVAAATTTKLAPRPATTMLDEQSSLGTVVHRRVTRQAARQSVLEQTGQPAAKLAAHLPPAPAKAKPVPKPAVKRPASSHPLAEQRLPEQPRAKRARVVEPTTTREPVKRVATPARQPARGAAPAKRARAPAKVARGVATAGPPAKENRPAAEHARSPPKEARKARPPPKKASIFDKFEIPSLLYPSTTERIDEGILRMNIEIRRAMEAKGPSLKAEECDHIIPVVTQWFNSSSSALGYFLNDGSCGCIFDKDTEHPPTGDENLPRSSMIIRGVEDDLRKLAEQGRESLDSLESAKVEFLEDRDTDGVFRHRMDLKKVAAKSELVVAEDVHLRRKQERFWTWKKVAKMLCSLNGGKAYREDYQLETATGKKRMLRTGSDVVKSFHKIGDTAMFVFADGHMQFDFPDHTKCILSKDGYWCILYCFYTRATRKLLEAGELKYDDVKGKRYIAYPLQQMLHLDEIQLRYTRRSLYRPIEVNPSLAKLPKANDIRGKIQFIDDALRNWRCWGNPAGRQPIGR